VQASLTRDLVASQLEDIRALAATNGWELDAELENLIVKATMTSPIDGEKYIVHVECEGFDEDPPYVEMENPETGKLGGDDAYFDDRGGSRKSLIANSDGKEDPILCHQFNRRVYEEDTAPHNDWTMGDWQSEAGELTTLGDILVAIYHRISDPDRYQGRYDPNR